MKDKKLTNYYNGITMYSVPITNYLNIQEYTYRTTDTSGSYSSPGFDVDLYSVEQLLYKYKVCNILPSYTLLPQSTIVFQRLRASTRT